MSTLTYAAYLDKIYGCFLGKTVIGTLGAPYEGIKMAQSVPFRQEMIDTMLPNDDLDLQVLWLDVAEKYGKDFTSDQLLDRFCNYCDYSPGEYGIMRKNHARGIHPPFSGRFSNDYYLEGMGCPIRSEIWACLSPLNPENAAEYASRDGQLDHGDESVYAERFFAALESAAFGTDETGYDVRSLIEVGLSVIPEDCKFAGLVADVTGWCDSVADIPGVRAKILRKYGHPDCTNMFQNIGITLAVLIKDGLDPIKVGMDALNCGFDTDCTCATAGAVIGAVRGAASLQKEYGWGDIRYVLGVRSERRSDLVFDFAEDVARLGVAFCPETVTDVPDSVTENAPVFETDASPVRVSAIYENFTKPGREEAPDCSIAPGDTRTVALVFENRTSSPITVNFTVDGPFVSDGGELTLDAGSDDAHIVVVSVPDDADRLDEVNLYRVNYTVGSYADTYTFGLAGAALWRAVGPIWKTDPECLTEDLLKVPNYWHLMKDPGYKGDPIDIVRRFHLNFAIDPTTAYLSDEALFAGTDGIGYETEVFAQREDSFEMSDICGFQGPCVVYLARELISPADEEVCIQLGYSAPVRLFVNGEMIAEHNGCDWWDAENLHIQKVKIRKGVNRIVLRLTQVNRDTKFSLVFSKGPTCAEHIVHYGSNNPVSFGS